MKMYGEMEAFFTSTLDGVSNQLHAAVALNLRKEPQIPVYRRRVRPRTGVNAVEKRIISCSFLKSNQDRPVRSPSLYRLSCPGFELLRVFLNEP
jgi:hypothetical protein